MEFWKNSSGYKLILTVALKAQCTATWEKQLDNTCAAYRKNAAIWENPTKYRNTEPQTEILQVTQKREKVSYTITQVSEGRIKRDGRTSHIYCPLETTFVTHLCCLLCDLLCFWMRSCFLYLALLSHFAAFVGMLATWPMDGRQLVGQCRF